MLQNNLFTMLAVVPHRNTNIFCFVGIGLVLSTISRKDGYDDQIAVAYIIYRAPNTQDITGDIQSK